jgi:hypothetical protein
MALDVVAKVQGARGLQCANQVEFDVLGREVVEEPSALAEENWPELDLDRVENAGFQALLRGIGTVQHDVAVTGCVFGLPDA